MLFRSNDTATTEIYTLWHTLSLHDALPICALSVLRFPEDGFATLTQPLTIEPMGVAMPPNDPLFLNMMENYLGALEGIGILELLEEKWFQDGSWLIQMP